MFLLTVAMICYTLGIMFLFRRSLILISNVLLLSKARFCFWQAYISLLVFQVLLNFSVRKVKKKVQLYISLV